MNTGSKEADFEKISNQNFEKITRKIANIGYQEGVYDGRQSKFQRDFDIGYATGFHSGFMLGKADGDLTYHHNTTNDTSSSSGKTTKTSCVVCTNINLKEKAVSFIVNEQKIYDETSKSN